MRSPTAVGPQRHGGCPSEYLQQPLDSRPRGYPSIAVVNKRQQLCYHPKQPSDNCHSPLIGLSGPYTGDGRGGGPQPPVHAPPAHFAGYNRWLEALRSLVPLVLSSVSFFGSWPPVVLLQGYVVLWTVRCRIPWVSDAHGGFP